MKKAKQFYIAHLVFLSYVTTPFRAEMTPVQASDVARALDKRKESGSIVDYYLGPPKEGPEWLHAQILNHKSLKQELMLLIDSEAKLKDDQRPVQEL